MSQQFEGNTQGYFKLREEIESKVISETNWSSYFSEHVTLDMQFEDPKTLCDSDLLTFHQISLETLKRFIDSRLEKEPLGFSLCVYVRAIYSDTKAELETRFADYPKGDGFADYLSAREQREGKETARKTGEYCIHCGSKNVRSNGDKWQCDDCKRQTRKR